MSSLDTSSHVWFDKRFSDFSLQRPESHLSLLKSLESAQPDVDGMLTERQLAEYFDGIGWLAAAVRPEIRSIICIDEDVRPTHAADAGFHISGSGELEAIGLQPVAERIASKILRIFRETGQRVQQITKHQDCGAGKMAFALAGSQPDLFGPGIDLRGCHNAYAHATVDPLAHRLTAILDRELGSEAWPLHSRFVSLADMGYPHGRLLHEASMITYDATGQVNIKDFELLPKSFQVTRRFMPVESAQRDAAVAASIAFGQAGLGAVEYFAPDRPLFILGLASQHAASEFGVDAITAEIRQLVQKIRSSAQPVLGAVIELPHLASA